VFPRDALRLVAFVPPMLLTSAAVIAFSPLLAHVPCRSRAPCIPMMAASDAESSGANSFDMSVLASRIEQVRSVPPPEAVRLLDLDSMVPRQRLAFKAPAIFIDTLNQLAEGDQSTPIVMVGRQRLAYNSHGVECTVERIGPEDDEEGSAEVVLAAGRLCEVVEVGDDEGSRWFGREGAVRWLNTEDLDAKADAMTNEVVTMSEGLEALANEWMALVQSGRERSPNQIQKLLEGLGPIPPADQPTSRALWIAALINPLPALGVALEIRPAVLMASTLAQRLQVAEMGLQDSIRRLSQAPGGSPLF